MYNSMRRVGALSGDSLPTKSRRVNLASGSDYKKTGLEEIKDVLFKI